MPVAPVVLWALAALVLGLPWLARRAAGAPTGSGSGSGSAMVGELTGRLSKATVQALAAQTIARYGLGADSAMLTIMAFTESSGNASIGVHGDGVSIGLMGVTELAARDNAGRGHLAYPATRAALMTAEASMYHAAAYVDWLRSWGGQARADDWVIRAYNTGPGGALAGAGSAHLASYAKRKQELGL